MAAWLVASALAQSLSPPSTQRRFTFNVTLPQNAVQTFDIEVHPEWAPLGAKRFGELVNQDFFTDVRFFRVIDGFMAQFGIHGDPSVSAKWRDANIEDCLLYTSPSPRDRQKSRMPSSA